MYVSSLSESRDKRWCQSQVKKGIFFVQQTLFLNHHISSVTADLSHLLLNFNTRWKF
jgi:hypothetical protein